MPTFKETTSGMYVMIGSIILSVGIAACTSQGNSEGFCAQAATFSATGIRDRHEAIDYLNELRRLVDISPPDLKADLETMLEYEEAYDPTTATEGEIDAINLIGFRVGTQIEARCGVQLPGIR